MLRTNMWSDSEGEWPTFGQFQFIFVSTCGSLFVFSSSLKSSTSSCQSKTDATNNHDIHEVRLNGLCKLLLIVYTQQ
jgi:hypothetical protein